jgi:hypothetical protein
MNHSCTANVRLCPIGELSPLRTASLAIDARRSLIVDHLPLSGIFSGICPTLYIFSKLSFSDQSIDSITIDNKCVALSTMRKN